MDVIFLSPSYLAFLFFIPFVVLFHFNLHFDRGVYFNAGTIIKTVVEIVIPSLEGDSYFFLIGLFGSELVHM